MKKVKLVLAGDNNSIQQKEAAVDAVIEKIESIDDLFTFEWCQDCVCTLN